MSQDISLPAQQSTPGQIQAPAAQQAHCLITASTDVEAMDVWLKEVSGHTRRSYRREAKRFYLFLTQYRGHTLATMAREDVLAYREFLENPPESWIGPPKPETDPEYKPFSGPLSSASAKQAMTILSGMMSYLIDSGYLVRNPFTLKRRTRTSRDEETGKHRGDGPRIDKWLTQNETQWLLQWVDQMPIQSEADEAHKERCYWLLMFLYHTGARREEIADAKMGHFRMQKDSDGVVRWWWHVVGKGSKEGKTPVPDVLMRALYRYRRHLGLSDIPIPTENSPAVRAIAGGKPSEDGLGEKGVYLVVREIGKKASEDAPLEFKYKLEKLTPHWLRHSITSHEIEAGLTLPEVQENRRHASITTTAGYAHSLDNKRHDKVNKRLK